MAGSIILCLFGYALVAMVAGGCIEEIGQDQNFVECMSSFQGYFSNIGSQTGSQNMDIMAVMCSPEGKNAMSCFFEYVAKCPDFASSSGMQIPGLNIIDIVRDGGFDVFCEMQTGPCSKVQECFQEMSGGMSAMRKKRGAPQPLLNHFQLFQAQAQMICQGPMKETVMCLTRTMKNCSSEVVRKVEKMFQDIIKATSGGMEMIGFEKSTKFLEEQCPKMPEDFGNNTCLAMNFMTGDFQSCYENMTQKYQDLNECGVIKDSKDCVGNFLESCGKEYSDFLSENTGFVFTSVPESCGQQQGDTSAASLTQAAFILTVAGALLATIF